MKLVIVESPTKIKKIQQFLPPGYVVDSCVGHIRDLPSKKSEVPAAHKDKEWADFGVDYTDGFKPHYITIRGKGKVITALKKKLKDADELYLATDEDREGEAIAWHLVEALNPKVPVKRMVFNEITKKAVLKALENPRPMDTDLVQAQETRRILDRLYGYSLSPLLWKKVGGNLSAGRVQSVAVRLVVQRERERRAFVTGSYWDLLARLDHAGRFDARLTHVDGKRIATGKDFDKDTGKIAEGKDVLLLEETQARDLANRCQTGTWQVTNVDAQQKNSNPAAPFITSTLQQEANNRLGYGAKRTMQIAQRLYQEGHITYMRTDSTLLSDEALEGAKQAIIRDHGESYFAGPRQFGKNKEGAQEAHEAIRPAGDVFAKPEGSGLSGDELRLYALIYNRTLASQMAPERFTTTTVTLACEEATFVARGRKTDFPGWRAAYPQRKDDDGELPALAVGATPSCDGVDAEGHETKPPARFTEATLVKALEDEAIGRPSTYASILDTIQSKGYVVLKGKALVPSFTAFAVTGLLERHFPQLVDTRFTATMEEQLDEIAAGDADWVQFLTDFFLAKDGLKELVAERMDSMDPARARIIDLGDLDGDFTVKIGRFGPYVELEEGDERHSASIPETLTPDELTGDAVQQLLKQAKEGPESLGKDPDTGLPVYVLTGRFGPYYQLGDADDYEGKKKPKRASLPKGKDLDAASLDEALFLLSLPKKLGVHPDGGEVSVGLGRFGPYVMLARGSEKDYRSLPKGLEMDAVTMTDALELLAKPKGGRRGPTVLREMGKHPKSGKPIQLLDGRYGPYLKHEKTNASLPKDMDSAKVTLEQAAEMIDAKAKGKS
ncbi:MAG: type I DNA topoisomerase [Thermoplasmatota archaeon]